MVRDSLFALDLKNTLKLEASCTKRMLIIQMFHFIYTTLVKKKTKKYLLFGRKSLYDLCMKCLRYAYSY